MLPAGCQGVCLNGHPSAPDVCLREGGAMGSEVGRSNVEVNQAPTVVILKEWVKKNYTYDQNSPFTRRALISYDLCSQRTCRLQGFNSDNVSETNERVSVVTATENDNVVCYKTPSKPQRTKVKTKEVWSLTNHF